MSGYLSRSFHIDHSITPRSFPAYNTRSVDESDYSSRSNTGMPSTLTFIIIKVCKTFRDRHNCAYVNIPVTETLERLKEKIVKQLDQKQPPNAFYLMLFDEKDYEWRKIDDSDPHTTMFHLRLHDYNILNLEKYSDIENNHQRSTIDRSSTSVMKDDALTLNLCTRPMNTGEYAPIETNSSTTLGQLRKQACERLNYRLTKRPLYLWTKNGWMKFKSDMDECTLASLKFDTFAFISFDSDDKKLDSKYPPGVCGLTNLGSTCFINSAIQCLSNVPELTRRILDFDDEMNAPLIGAFIRVIKMIWSGKYPGIEPSPLLLSIRDNMPNYTRYGQQDAQEFMNCFLHLIHTELTNEETLITELFYGRIQSIVTCTGCKKTETTNELISFLPLPVGQNIEKSILYVKPDGEQRLVSVFTESSTRTIADLIDCFIKQHESTVTDRKRVLAVRMSSNDTQEQYSNWQWLSDIREDQLAFIELPEKTVAQKYIGCSFLDNHTKKSFRPPVYLVCPKYGAYYTDLSEQVDQILAHLCSSTDAPTSACHLYWINDRDDQRQLSAESSKHDPLVFISEIVIEMDNEWIRVYEQRHTFSRPLDNSSLSGLLTNFFREETLDGEYHCSTCPSPTVARQKAVLDVPLPRVLIIQLKRFTYDTHSNDKIDIHITFPSQDLDLSDYVVKNDDNTRSLLLAKYDLVAVCNHTGSLAGGHYTTYAKNDRNGRWYSFNDDYVRSIDEKDIVTKNAYILVYVNKNNGEDGDCCSK